MLSGDAVEPGDASEVPGKSFLFFLTSFERMVMGLSRDIRSFLAKQLTFSTVRCAIDGP